MNCPICGSDTRVIESRSNGESRDRRGTGTKQLISRALQNAGEQAVSWYTPDWFARKRRCLSGSCGHTYATLEVSAEDIIAMCKEGLK